MTKKIICKCLIGCVVGVLLGALLLCFEATLFLWPFATAVICLSGIGAAIFGLMLLPDEFY